MGQTVDRAWGEDRVIEVGNPLFDAVVGEDYRGAAMALADDFVEIARLLGD